MSVLAVPLSLGDPAKGGIVDVEALVNKVISDRMRKWPRGQRTLNEHQRSDLVSYLIGVAWELSERYDPAKDKRPNLASYVAHILGLRIADWYRQTFGDTRHGDRPVVLSLDAPIALSQSADEEDRADRLVDTLVSSTGDPAADRSPDLVGVLNGGSGPDGGTHAAVGEPATSRAPRRDRSGAAGVTPARSKKQPRVPKTRRPPQRPPICPDCYTVFLDAFVKVNAKVKPEQQLTPEQLEEKASRRARAVKFGDTWACPRCTKLEDAEGTELMLKEAYPNRQTRRAAVGKGVPKNRTTRPSERRWHQEPTEETPDVQS